MTTLPPSKPPVKVESKDERVTIRLTPTQREALTSAALARGDELSRYLRECAMVGHSVFQSAPSLKVTVG